MIMTLPQRMRQLLALALLAALVVAAWLVVFAPLARAVDVAHAQILEKRSILGRFLAAAPETGAASKAPAQPDIKAFVLNGANDALKAANLQSAVAGILESQGLRFTSSRVLPTRQSGGLRLIVIDAGFEATLPQVLDILQTLDAHRPLIAVNRLALTAAPDLEAAGAAIGNRLSVQIEVAGAAPGGKG